MTELISVRIPNSNKWSLKDIEVKAKKIGMDKSGLILKAVDIMMNFDEAFYKRIENYSKGLHVPEWLVIQNMIIKEMAEEAARAETGTSKVAVLDEFIFISESYERRLLTGEELFNELKKQYSLVIIKKELPHVDISDDELLGLNDGESWGPVNK